MSARAFQYLDVPGSVWSHTVGKAAQVRLPEPFMRFAVAAYSKVFHVSMSEAAVPPDGFTTFGDFFTRRLRPGARQVDADPDVIVSPCDGRIQAIGELAPGATFEVKGRRFGVRELTGGMSGWGAAENMCGYVVIYLSPGDYHRVHAPSDGAVNKVFHLEGTSWPVNKMGQTIAPWAVVENERVVFQLSGTGGDLLVVMVGALAVKNIEVLVSRSPNQSSCMQQVSKGDEIGVFNLGSTVVLLWQGETKLAAVEGQKVVMGQRLTKRVR